MLLLCPTLAATITLLNMPSVEWLDQIPHIKPQLRLAHAQLCMIQSEPSQLKERLHPMAPSIETLRSDLGKSPFAIVDFSLSHR